MDNTTTQQGGISEVRIILVDNKSYDGWVPNFLAYCYYASNAMSNEAIIAMAKEESIYIREKEHGFKLFAITRSHIDGTSVEPGMMELRGVYTCMYRDVDIKHAIWKLDDARSNNKKKTKDI